MELSISRKSFPMAVSEEALTQARFYRSANYQFWRGGYRICEKETMFFSRVSESASCFGYRVNQDLSVVGGWIEVIQGWLSSCPAVYLFLGSFSRQFLIKSTAFMLLSKYL